MLMQILCKTTNRDYNISQPTKKVDQGALIFPVPDFIEGLNSELIKTFKSRLMKDDGDQVMNLNGFAGSGKSTLALQLWLDIKLRGWFNDNVEFVSLGSMIETNYGKILGSELREKWNGRKGLLVLDNVEPASEDIVEQCLNQMPSNSKILVISRVALSGIGRPVEMELLGDQDAVTLLSHSARSIGTTSYNLPDDRMLLRVARFCGGFPIAIKMVGRDLRGKPAEFWEQYLSEREQQGNSILDSHPKLLDYLHNSLQDSKEFKDIREFFMDLALFAEDEFIPVSALHDVWAELYYTHQDEDGNKAKAHAYLLTTMNLADRVVRISVSGSSRYAENDLDDRFLTQSYVLRELAKRYSGEEAGEFERSRLILEINGNDPPLPQCLLPQQPQRGIKSYLHFMKASRQQPVAARLLSITTDHNDTPDLCNIRAAEAQVLVLNLRTHEYRLRGKFIKEMKNLKVLIVTNYGSRPTQLKEFKLLRLLKTLKRMRLQNISVPCVWELKNLHKLSLYSCEVNTAFEDNLSVKFCKPMPNLVGLKIVDCEDLVNLPAGICNIVNLKKLTIAKCRNFTELPNKIRKLKKLESLRITYCTNFEEMTESVSELESLNFLDISHCQTLRKLPVNVDKLQKLTKLYMQDCLKIDELPDSIKNLKSLKKVICDEKISSKWDDVAGSKGFELEVRNDDDDDDGAI